MNITNFGLKIKQLMALALIPMPNVVEKFDKLMYRPFFVDIDYFEQTWIGRPIRRNIRLKN